jgi:RimJ/RimL family protein N-acetyltransferase
MLYKNESLKFYNKVFGELSIIPLNHQSQNDYDSFKEIVCDFHIMKTSSVFGRNIINNEKELKELFIKMVESNDSCGIGFNKILNSNDELMGIAGLAVIKKDKLDNPLLLEMGYLLKNKYHRQRVASDFSKFFMIHLLNNFDSFEEVVATTLPDNIASQIILLKLGFNFIGKKQKNKEVINLYSFNKKNFIPDDAIIKDCKKYILQINNKKYYSIDVLEPFVL